MEQTRQVLAGRTRAFLAVGVLVLVLAAGALAYGLRAERTGGDYLVPGLEVEVRVPADGLVREAHVVVPEFLLIIYDAFALTDEAGIYDRLATIAAGDALEALYLERAGALASSGLPDQVVHGLEMRDWKASSSGDRATIEASWLVLGEVGHAEHTHMRGNVYSATLILEPVEHAWRLTSFKLTDVDRTDAGTLTTPPPEDIEATRSAKPAAAEDAAKPAAEAPTE